MKKITAIFALMLCMMVTSAQEEKEPQKETTLDVPYILFVGDTVGAEVHLSAKIRPKPAFVKENEEVWVRFDDPNNRLSVVYDYLDKISPSEIFLRLKYDFINNRWILWYGWYHC